MLAKTIMVQGTASNVGKSVLAAALCRILKNKGFKVAPFKAQNMANNSYATLDGGEIGRAQAVQAYACGIEPSVLMNPVLLKPTTDRKSQLIVLGKPVKTLSAMEYQKYKKSLVPIVKKSLQSLMASHDYVVIEGAGSPAEINLKKQDIVNMAVAKMVSSPVILVGDIDKGGVFAQLIGTFELLDPEEKKLVKAFLINKFRGDKKILAPGLKWIEKKTKRKILGVIPYLPNHGVSEEDSVTLTDRRESRASSPKPQLLIQVIRLPRISNFTDFEVLGKESDVQLEYIEKPNRHVLADLLIIPGSKSTIADLKFLWNCGFVDYIKRCISAGVPLVGICGGYQMLGERILDPEHVEANKSSCEGLGLLPTVTVFRNEKTTAQVKAIHLESQTEIEGYEIHMGCTQGRDGHKPLFKIKERNGMEAEGFDGMVSSSLNKGPFIMGTYIHGVFDRQPFRRYFLDQVRKIAGFKPCGKKSCSKSAVNPYDRLAKLVEDNVDMKFLNQVLTLP